MMGQQPSTNRKASSRLLFALVALALFAIGSSKIDNSWLITFLGFAVALLQWLFPLEPTSLQLPRMIRQQIRQQFFRSYWLAICLTVPGALFTLLAWFVHVNSVVPIDIAIKQGFQKNKTPLLQVSMLTVSYLGNQPILFFAFIALTALVFWLMRLRLEALLIVWLSSISLLITVLIKQIVSHPHSIAHLVEILLQAGFGPGFPNGYVVEYVTFWGLLFMLGLILFKGDRWWH